VAAAERGSMLQRRVAVSVLPAIKCSLCLTCTHAPVQPCALDLCCLPAEFPIWLPACLGPSIRSPLQFYGAWWNREAEKVVFITELMSSGAYTRRRCCDCCCKGCGGLENLIH
jgi:hypothetical protein